MEKQKRKEYARNWYLENKEERDKYRKQWYEKNKTRLQEKQLKNHEERWSYRIFKNFGINNEQYYEMEKNQKYKCAICGTTEPGGQNKKWCIDHDHETGKVRGLLCYYCNVGLGHFKDDRQFLEEAIKYLDKEQKVCYYT